MASRTSRSGSSTIYYPPIEHQPVEDKVLVGMFHFSGTVVDLPHNNVTRSQQLVAQRTKRQGPDGQHVGTIAFLKCVLAIAIACWPCAHAAGSKRY